MTSTNQKAPKVCENTACNQPINSGVVVGLSRDFCEQCEIKAQERVDAYRALGD